MTCVKTLLFAFVALSLTLMTVAQAAQPTISHNAAVRRHNAMIEARPARRSVTVGDGKMMMQRRQTADQIAQAAALKKWNDDFHAKNAEWQQAAIAALAKGQTPPSYDEYWSGKSSGSSSPSSSSSSNADSTPSAPSSSGSGSAGQSSAAPAQQQQQQQQAATTGPSTSGSSSSSNNSGSESDECEDDAATETASSTSSTAAPASTPAKGAAAAAASGSKNNAAQSKPNSGSSSSSSSSSSSQATSGKFDGQATYYAPGLGACGWTNGDSDYIVAISHSLFDSFGTGNPNNNPVCGHKIAATYGGKTITVSVADRCEGCAWGDLDFTPTGFSALADMSKGRLDGLTWSWIGAAPK